MLTEVGNLWYMFMITKEIWMDVFSCLFKLLCLTKYIFNLISVAKVYAMIREIIGLEMDVEWHSNNATNMLWTSEHNEGWKITQNIT